MKRALGILKALSDQTRLRIFMTLESGPLCLGQITEILLLAASTVSKHLQVLVEAGLLETRQEGRWHYFSWVGDAAKPEILAMQKWLRDLLRDDSIVRDDGVKRAVAMHSFPAPPPRDAKAKVLFLCTGNSCRSQMAEALLRKYAGNKFDVFSAGLDPRPIPAMAFKVMNEIGLDIRNQRPKSVLDFLGKTHIGYLVTVCPNAEKRCPIFPGVSHRLYWPVADPANVSGARTERLSAFRRVRDELDRLISTWLTGIEGQFKESVVLPNSIGSRRSHVRSKQQNSISGHPK